MHEIGCATVTQWLTEAESCGDESMLVLGRFDVPGMRIVVCCSNSVAGQPPTALRTMATIKSAANARHGLGIRIESQVPRLISIDGETQNKQIHFRDVESGAFAEGFFKECSTEKLRSSKPSKTCAEVVVEIVSKSKGVDEIINGRITVYENPRHWATRREPTEYKLRLKGDPI